ncbi:MAG: Hsp33 family molecular chaperone HslO [Clostridia bacterium]|nr:Hsp33 family molecular chaperone HslO [Clostridia bacterium]
MQDKQNGCILRGMTHDGSARLLVMNSRDLVNEMIRVHHTAPTATAAVGRTLTAASMIGTLLPEAGDTLTVTFQGDGPLGRMIVVADYYGNVKSYVENPLADPPRKTNGKLDVGAAVGAGTLSFVKSLGDQPPQTGLTDIVTGEIAEDIATYFAVSEQIPTVLSLGVLVDKDRTCLSAGGVLVQLMPFPDEQTVSLIERNAARLPSMSHLFAEGKTLKDVADLIMEDIPYDVFDTVAPAYRCDCSNGRMKKKLLSIGEEQIRELLQQQQDEGKPRELTAICRFCNHAYTYTEQQLLSSK